MSREHMNYKWAALTPEEYDTLRKNNWNADEVAKDMVGAPPHYRSHPSGIECIEVTRHMGFNLGNAIKYIWRADLKHDAIEDLKKAVWYLQDEIQKREEK